MAHVVCEACINCKRTDCVDVCPVDCFREGPNFLVIDPDECIDCAMCIPECPEAAIFANSAFNSMNSSCPSGTSSSAKIAASGHSGIHTALTIFSSFTSL